VKSRVNLRIFPSKLKCQSQYQQGGLAEEKTRQRVFAPGIVVVVVEEKEGMFE
jgi:hypothetical protein